MKKILTLAVAITCFGTAVNAQDAIKSVRFGIRATPAISWMTPDNDKKIEGNGAVLKAGLGLQLEFKLTEVAWFQTGVDYTGAGFKANYQKADTAFYLYQDDQIIETEVNGDSITSPSPITSSMYSHRLLTRKYNLGYVHIPLCFKFKTKDIGGLTYFGNIGGNIFIKMKGRANDEVEQFSYATGVRTNSDIDKIDIGKQINLLTMAANVGGGAEYNLSGSTSLFAAISYQHHFMNAAKKDSGYLIRGKTEAGTYKLSEFQNAMKMRQIVLTLGILF